MKKTLKIVLITLGSVFLLLVLAIGMAVLYFDAIAKTAVEKGGTISMGVDTTLNDLSLSFVSTAGSLKGLRVANPGGYETPHFLKLNEGGVTIETSTLMKDRIVVPSLSLTGIDINLEKKDGKANYDVILANLKAFQDSLPKDQGGSGPDKTTQGKGKTFVIKEIVIKDVTVHADTLGGIGGKLQRLEVKIPEIRLTEIGNDSDQGVAMSQVTGTIMTALFEAIVKHGAGVLPAEALQGIGKGIEGVGKLGEVGVQALGDVTGAAGKAAEDLTKGVGDASKGLTDGLGGLLGGEKKK